MPDPTTPDWATAPAATATTAPDWAAPTAPAPDPNLQQLSEYHPTWADRAENLLHEIRTSGPVEKVLGRTAEEIQDNPALAEAPSTTDAGVMGLFQSATPVVTPYEQPTTALDGLHNWAAGVVNSIASPGGIVSAPLTGPGRIMGPIVQRALLLTFGAQGAKMGYEGAKDLVQKQFAPDWAQPPDKSAQTVMDIGNILAGGLMAAGGVHAIKGDAVVNPTDTPPARPTEDWLPKAPVTPAPDWAAPAAASPNVETPSAAAGAPGQAVPAPGEAPAPSSPAGRDAQPDPRDAGATAAIAAPLDGTGATMVRQAVNEITGDKAPLPVSLVQQAGLDPSTLSPGYALNAAGTHYEFTPPTVKLSPEQELAQASVQAMQELRAQKAANEGTQIQQLKYTIRPNGKFDVAAQSGAEGTLGLENNLTYDQLVAKVGAPVADLVKNHLGDDQRDESGWKSGTLTADKINQLLGDAEAGQPLAGQPTNKGAETLAKPTRLIPVDVRPEEIKAAAETLPRPPDVLDAISEQFPGGVKFESADQGEQVRTARGEAAQRMFMTKGEPADKVLDGLHREGLFLRIQSPDDLADAMKQAGDVRLNAPKDLSAARTMVEDQKRTQIFEATAYKPRANVSQAVEAGKGVHPDVLKDYPKLKPKAQVPKPTVNTEPMPAGQLFVGDQFTLNGQPVRVTDQVMDAETGKPSHVEVEGAYGKQTIPAAATVHLDKGSLESPGLIKGTAAEKWADETIAKSRGRLNAGVDPELLAAYSVKGAALLEGGLRDIDAWSKAMVENYGPRIRAWLQDIWSRIQTANRQKFNSDVRTFSTMPRTAVGRIEKGIGTSFGGHSGNYLIDKYDSPHGDIAIGSGKTSFPSVLWSKSARPGEGRSMYLGALKAMKEDGREGLATSNAAEPEAIHAWLSLERRGLARLEEVHSEDRPDEGYINDKYIVYHAEITRAGEKFLAEQNKLENVSRQSIIPRWQQNETPSNSGARGGRGRLETEQPLKPTETSSGRPMPERQPSNGGARSSTPTAGDATPNLSEGSQGVTAVLAKLDTLKVPTGAGQLHAFGLIPEVWNTVIEGVKLAVKGGMAIKDAIDSVIAKYKATGALGQNFDEGGAREYLKNLGERQFNAHLQDSEDISDALKGAVTNTLYERRAMDTDASYAQHIMEGAGGPDQARRIFNTETRLPQPVRLALGMQILKSLDHAKRYADAADFHDRDFAQAVTDTAQGLSMMQAWSAMSKDGKLFWAQKKILDSGRDTVAPVRPDIDAAATELRRQNLNGIEHATADPAVQATAKTAVTEAVANSAETHKGIVMELTEPWASAQVILDMARDKVRAKADELLTKQPRPIGFTAAKHLGSIMDDLAKRAAEIASGHYQGAEPGVILRDKLVQRLGISQDAAGKLANALDKEFARQVKAAADALPKRIAAQIARAKAGLPANATETAVDRSIRRQLATTKQTVGGVVRDHWTKIDATKADIEDKLVKQAGLSGDAAAKLADVIRKRLDALLARSKQAALEQLLKPVKRLGLAKVGMVDKLVKLSNLGAFDDAKFWNAMKERMNLPEWTGALRDQLAAQADKIGRIPEDRVEDAQRAQTEFLNTLERAKGISNLELGLAFYMQNILSGLTTHVRVAIHTSAQMMAATTAEMTQALTSGRVQDVPLIFEALAKGAGRALNQQKDILRSGLVVGSKLQHIVPLSVLEQIHFGEKGGTTFRQGPVAKAVLENKLASVLNLWKYNGRLITAQHMIYFAPAEEMKVALLAARQARTEGLTGRAAVDRARQMLGYGAGQVRAAEVQAMREGLDGTRARMRVAEILRMGVPAAMRETARDYALRQTFLNEPYGFAGALANIVAAAKQSENAKLATAARVIVPFTRIAANVFNEGLNYTPVGALRAWTGKTELLGQKFADITPEVRDDLRKELYAKSALGSMLLTAIAYKAAQGLNQPNPPFTVYGAGPANPQDKDAWRASGAIPYSVKVGGGYISYANTPGNVMLAALGNYLDGTRDAALYQRPGAKRLSQDLPMRAAAATVGAGKVVMEQPFLQSLMEIASLAKEDNAQVSARGVIQTAARTASSFMVPNLVRQVDRFFDPTSYDQKDLAGILTGQVPFVRQTGRPLLNALGQPIQSPVFGMFTSARTADPLTELLTDHNAWPAAPDPNRTAVNGVPLSADEFYTYNRTRGEALAKMLSAPNVARVLDQLTAQSDRLKQAAAVQTNPVARARLTAMATRLEAGVMAKYEAAADKVASTAIIRQRGY